MGAVAAGATAAASATPAATASKSAAPAMDNSGLEVLMSPAARKLIEENKLDPNSVPSTGKDGRITKEDVVNFISGPKVAPAAKPVTSVSAAPSLSLPQGARPEQRVPMTRLRAKIAERLLEATQTTAMLTTFNEVNMAEVMALRSRYKDMFEKKHSGVRLGFMSFFVRACIEALKRFPAVNASIDGNDIIYHGYQDIGVAVSSPRGLVVPVLRNADALSLAQIEKSISDFGAKAKDGKLGIEELTGGTFSISNGGTFGSMLSTPIINPPQSAILGVHATKDRAVVENGQVVVRPMNYFAMSYDHRIIDGREAVLGLVTIKEAMEDPSRLLFDI
jgi:2-oxoglutarate dehydrogenase E2 component (dihydrolipoamide succinyltransferase)